MASLCPLFYIGDVVTTPVQSWRKQKQTSTTMAHEPHSHIRKTLLSLTLRKFHQTFPYFFTWISFLLFSFYSHVFVNPSNSIYTHNVCTKIEVSVLCCLWWSRDCISATFILIFYRLTIGFVFSIYQEFLV